MQKSKQNMLLFVLYVLSLASLLQFCNNSQTFSLFRWTENSTLKVFYIFAVFLKQLSSLFRGWPNRKRDRPDNQAWKPYYFSCCSVARKKQKFTFCEIAMGFSKIGYHVLYNNILQANYTLCAVVGLGYW